MNAQAIGTGTLRTINGGIIEAYADGSTTTLSTNNAITINGNFSFNDDPMDSLNLGTGTVTLGNSISINCSAATGWYALVFGGSVVGGSHSITITGQGMVNPSNVIEFDGKLDTTVSAVIVTRRISRPCRPKYIFRRHNA